MLNYYWQKWFGRKFDRFNILHSSKQTVLLLLTCRLKAEIRWEKIWSKKMSLMGKGHIAEMNIGLGFFRWPDKARGPGRAMVGPGPGQASMRRPALC